MLKTSDYTRGTLRPTDQQIWDEYYMSKPTDTTSWHPEEIIGEGEQESYDRAWDLMLSILTFIALGAGTLLAVSTCS